MDFKFILNLINLKLRTIAHQYAKDAGIEITIKSKREGLIQNIIIVPLLTHKNRKIVNPLIKSGCYLLVRIEDIKMLIHNDTIDEYIDYRDQEMLAKLSKTLESEIRKWAAHDLLKRSA